LTSKAPVNVAEASSFMGSKNGVDPDCAEFTVKKPTFRGIVALQCGKRLERDACGA
jgi:hypothetical protein